MKSLREYISEADKLPTSKEKIEHLKLKLLELQDDDVEIEDWLKKY